MIDIKEVRQTASNYMQAALVEDATGDKKEALRLFELAYEAEKQAALSLLSNFEAEPFRAILFRSAASLAINCKKYTDAKVMIQLGLTGNPPADIADELLDVYDRVHQEMKENIKQKEEHFTQSTDQYFWLKGTLKEANAQRHQITIVSDDQKVAKVNVPNGLSHIVRRYWDETVSAYIRKQGKLLTLIDVAAKNT
jgi:hypothetical protein